MLPWFRMSEGQTTAAIQAAQRFAAMESALQALIDGGGGVNYIHQAEEILSDTQIRALPTTNVLIASAPGANKIITPVSAWLVTHFEAGAYTAAADASWQLFLGSQAEGDTYISSVVRMQGSLATTVSRAAQLVVSAEPGGGAFLGILTSFPFSTASLANKGLYVRDWFGGVADYTGGHPSNTATILVSYFVWDVVTRQLVAA